MIDIYKQALIVARIKAKYHGYAIALHGTGYRDLDLLAIPWTEEASEPARLVLDIICAFQFQFGHETVVVSDGDLAVLRLKADGKVKEHSWPSACTKPHGRAAFSINIGPNLFVDLSVMPRITKYNLQK